MSRIIFLVNDVSFFLSHRAPLALAARDNGYEVVVVCPDSVLASQVTALGLDCYFVAINRSGRNPVRELFCFYSIFRVLCFFRPDILHLVTIKPVLYGGLAARLSPVGGVVSAVSGLGYVFTASGRKAAFMRKLVAFLYRLAFGKDNLRVIFQNPDDRDVLLNAGALDVSKVRMIRGSGVDLGLYQALPEPEGLPVVCMAARLLRDKGVQEYVEAVRLLRKRGVRAVFKLAGDVDPGNPTSVTAADLSAWKQEGLLDVLGYRSDMAQLFAASHLVVLPSYREGLPKVLIEAAACGRAVVTTDVPGCRDAIEPDVTGLLVPVKDATALADAIQRLIEDEALRKRMGAAGRLLAEREFAIEKVVQQHLDIYAELEANRAR